jgi:hypothetical protein
MYTIFDLRKDQGHEGAGLTLHEVFVRLYALAERNYRFERVDGVLRLSCSRNEPKPVPAFFIHRHLEYEFSRNPTFESRNPNEEEARRELMAVAIKHGLDTYCVVTDEKYRRETAKQALGNSSASLCA